MKEFLRRNSSTILTCVGAVGVVATTVMAVKATPKAVELIKKAEAEKNEALTKFEIVKVAGTTYIPTVITGVATLACIFGANVISKRQQATLMSAYALLDSSYKEYKKKVDELYGEEAGRQVRAEIAKDKYTGDITLSNTNEELFYDFYSGRYFHSTTEAVLWAEYETNRSLFVNSAVSVNEYYELLGLDPLPEYESIGWAVGKMEDTYWHPWIEFDHEEIVIDDSDDGHEGLECKVVYMPLEPFMDYLDY